MTDNFAGAVFDIVFSIFLLRKDYFRAPPLRLAGWVCFVRLFSTLRFQTLNVGLVSLICSTFLHGAFSNTWWLVSLVFGDQKTRSHIDRLNHTIIDDNHHHFNHLDGTWSSSYSSFLINDHIITKFFSSIYLLPWSIFICKHLIIFIDLESLWPISSLSKENMLCGWN